MIEIIRGILYGLIASSVIGVIITIGARVFQGKVEEYTTSKKVGLLFYALLIFCWYIGLIWYWLNLLSQL